MHGGFANAKERVVYRDKKYTNEKQARSRMGENKGMILQAMDAVGVKEKNEKSFRKGEQYNGGIRVRRCGGWEEKNTLPPTQCQGSTARNIYIYERSFLVDTRRSAFYVYKKKKK